MSQRTPEEHANAAIERTEPRSSDIRFVPRVSSLTVIRPILRQEVQIVVEEATADGPGTALR